MKKLMGTTSVLAFVAAVVMSLTPSPLAGQAPAKLTPIPVSDVVNLVSSVEFRLRFYWSPDYSKCPVIACSGGACRAEMSAAPCLMGSLTQCPHAALAWTWCLVEGGNREVIEMFRRRGFAKVDSLTVQDAWMLRRFLIDTLRSIAAATPDEPLAVGELVHYLIADGRAAEAEAAARDLCHLEIGWCQALRALAVHRGGRSMEAERLFD